MVNVEAVDLLENIRALRHLRVGAHDDPEPGSSLQVVHLILGGREAVKGLLLELCQGFGRNTVAKRLEIGGKGSASHTMRGYGMPVRQGWTCAGRTFIEYKRPNTSLHRSVIAFWVAAFWCHILSMRH